MQPPLQDGKAYVRGKKVARGRWVSKEKFQQHLSQHLQVIQSSITLSPFQREHDYDQKKLDKSERDSNESSSPTGYEWQYQAAIPKSDSSSSLTRLFLDSKLSHKIEMNEANMLSFSRDKFEDPIFRSIPGSIVRWGQLKDFLDSHIDIAWRFNLTELAREQQAQYDQLATT